MMYEVTGRLESWHIDNIFPNIIWGFIYGDAKRRWKDGTRIHTSYIVTPTEEWIEGAEIKTQNSVYLLGKRMKSTANGD